jgi:hypothetical protein
MYSERVVKAELEYPGALTNGTSGMAVRRLQEWLTFHDCATVIDDDFGGGTERALTKFQTANGTGGDGRLNKASWEALVAPMQTVTVDVQPPAPMAYPRALLRLAKLHLGQSPVGLGGDNRGPWVRLYMQGNDGPEWRWCAGFVSTLMHQAARLSGVSVPIAGSVSCDTLAAQAQSAGRLVRETDLTAGRATTADLGACAIFLVRRTPTDWVHTGLAFEFGDEAFSTIEGNTNDGGSSNGFTVLKRSRGYKDKDFIRLD